MLQTGTAKMKLYLQRIKRQRDRPLRKTILDLYTDRVVSSGYRVQNSYLHDWHRRTSLSSSTSQVEVRRTIVSVVATVVQRLVRALHVR